MLLEGVCPDVDGGIGFGADCVCIALGIGKSMVPEWSHVHIESQI